MRDYLAPAFLFFFSSGLVATVYAVARWRDGIYARGGHLFLVSPALVVLGLFFLSRGAASDSLGAAAPALILGGVAISTALAVQLLALHRFLQGGSSGSAPDGGSN